MSKTRKQRNGKVYKVHDNGGRPFFVEIKGNTVSVSKNMDTFEFVNGKSQKINEPYADINAERQLQI